MYNLKWVSEPSFEAKTAVKAFSNRHTCMSGQVPKYVQCMEISNPTLSDESGCTWMVVLVHAFWRPLSSHSEQYGSLLSWKNSYSLEKLCTHSMDFTEIMQGLAQGDDPQKTYMRHVKYDSEVEIIARMCNQLGVSLEISQKKRVSQTTIHFLFFRSTSYGDLVRIQGVLAE